MALDLKSFCQRLGLDYDVQLDNAQPALDAENDEQLSCSYANVELAVGDSGSSAGSGTLFITTRRLVWVANSSSSSTCSSLACTYRQISMHAVSRDTEAYKKSCVYIQLDEGSEMMGGNEEDEEEELAAELRLVPTDDAEVEAIFTKLCDCSALNPDSDIEDEAGAQLFFDEAEVMAGLPADQRAALLATRAEGALGLQDGEDELDELMADDPERFGDDEGEEEGEGGGQEAAAAGGAANGHQS